MVEVAAINPAPIGGAYARFRQELSDALARAQAAGCGENVIADLLEGELRQINESRFGRDDLAWLAPMESGT